MVDLVDNGCFFVEMKTCLFGRVVSVCGNGGCADEGREKGREQKEFFAGRAMGEEECVGGVECWVLGEKEDAYI